MTETTTATEYETLTIQDLKQALSEPLKEAGLRFRGWVMENLSIDPNSRLAPWRNGTRWINVSDQYGHKAKVCIPPSVWLRAAEKGYDITNDAAIDVALNTISVDKWMQIQIEALAVRVSGQSKLEAMRENIFKYIDQHGYADRIKKPLPVMIRNVAIITTLNSTIESDITNLIGIPKAYISDHRFDGTAVHLKKLIQDVGRRLKHDIICLYRGGREDEYMFVFSDPIVLDAVVNCSVPVVTALGHERDVPPVQLVADQGFASPSEFAKFVRQWNDNVLITARQSMQNINGMFNRYLHSIERNNILIISNINGIASELKQKHSRKKYRRNIAVIVSLSVLTVAAVVTWLFFFSGRV